jgi:hypothetical protein
LAALIFASSVVSLVSASPSFAVVDAGGGISSSGIDLGTLSSSVTPQDQANSASYYVILSGCFWHATDGKIATSGENPAPSAWFNQKDQTPVYLDGAKTTCAAVATKALALWGWGTNYGTFLKNAGCSYDGTSLYTCSPNTNLFGNNNNETRADNFKHAVLAQAYPSANKSHLKDDDVPLSDAGKYVRYLSIFKNQCSPHDLGTMDTLSQASDPTTLNRINNDWYSVSKNVVTVYTSVNMADGDSSVAHGLTYQTTVSSSLDLGQSGNSFQSQTLLAGGESKVNTYGHIDQSWGSGGNIDNTGDMEICTVMAGGNLFAGAISNYAAAYAKYTIDYPGATPTALQGDESKSDSTTTCAIEGIGWIVCPVVNLLAGIADTAFGFLSDKFLNVDVSLLNTDPKATDATTGDLIGTGAYTAWQTMRSFANVVLIIAFLVIVFSQLTGIGITNYGIKKLLPKLVIVAVLINVSFLICQIGVDLSNILGYGLKSLLAGIAGSATSITTAAGDALSTTNGWSGIADTVLGGAAAGLGVVSAGGISLAFVALLGMLLSAVVALVMIFFILVVRQMLIVLLVVIAPLAFAAFLLPNTEELFTKWRKLFTQMLLLFPVIGLIFGGSTLASAIMKSAWSSSSNTLGQIVAAGVLVLPLFLVPSVLKGALSGIGAIGTKIGGLGATWGKAASKGVTSKYADSDFNRFNQTKKADTKARISAGNYRGRGGLANPRNWHSRANARLNDSRAFNAATGGFGASRFLGTQGQNRKDMADAIAMFGGDDDLAAAWAADGGQHGATYNALHAPQQAQYERLRSAGHSRKPTSYLAAVQQLSESGHGSAAQVDAALTHAERTGASATDVAGARQAATAAYRRNGRGDAVGDLLGVAQVQGWGQVGAASVHRDGIAAGSAGAASYQAFLAANPENARQALAGFDQMEGRAKVLAEPMIIAAAQAAAPGTGITDIQGAKAHFNIR